MSFDRIWFAARLGQIAYPDAWDLQLRLVEARQANRLERDAVLLLEHPPVFTLGKRGGRESLLVPEETLARHGIPILQVERGGNITYHGPGQLVVYPIVHLPGMRHRRRGHGGPAGRGHDPHLRRLRGRGRPQRAQPRSLGRHAQDRRIGLAVRRGVSFHGLALNVDPDLTPFGFVQPCGLQGVGVTSIVREAGRPVKMEEALASAERNIEAVFGVRLEPLTAEELLKKSHS